MTLTLSLTPLHTHGLQRFVGSAEHIGLRVSCLSTGLALVV